MPDSYLSDLARRSGLTARAGPNEARRRLGPFERELLRWVYGRVVALCEARRVTPVFLYMQNVTERAETWRTSDRTQILDVAKDAGFLILDLTGVFEGREPSTLSIAPNDGHPNALGSQLIADRLYSLLRQHTHELSMPVMSWTDVSERGNRVP